MADGKRVFYGAYADAGAERRLCGLSVHILRSAGGSGAADDSLSQAIGKRFCEVGAGQTLWEICMAYRLSMQALLRLNPQIAKPNEVQSGTRVRVR